MCTYNISYYPCGAQERHLVEEAFSLAILHEAATTNDDGSETCGACATVTSYDEYYLVDLWDALDEPANSCGQSGYIYELARANQVTSERLIDAEDGQ